MVFFFFCTLLWLLPVIVSRDWVLESYHGIWLWHGENWYWRGWAAIVGHAVSP